MVRNSIIALMLFMFSFAVAFSQENVLNADNENAYLRKGVSSFGFRVGLSKKEVFNDVLFKFIDIDEVKNVGADFSLSGSWFIDDNVALGVKLSYGFSDQRYTINTKLLNLILEATKFNSNIATSSFSLGTGVKNYVPFGNSNRFFVYNETNITYSYIASLSRDIYDDGNDIKKMMKNTHEISLGLSPGVMYFLKKGFAFEFTLNPVMMSYTRSFIKKDERQSGSVSDFSLDFKFNLFKIYFGFAYYFGLDNKAAK